MSWAHDDVCRTEGCGKRRDGRHRFCKSCLRKRAKQRDATRIWVTPDTAENEDGQANIKDEWDAMLDWLSRLLDAAIPVAECDTGPDGDAAYHAAAATLMDNAIMFTGAVVKMWVKVWDITGVPPWDGIQPTAPLRRH